MLNYLNDIEYSISRTSFAADARIFTAASSTNEDIIGSAISFGSLRHACLAGIGEFFERERFLIDRKIDSCKNTKLLGYSLIDKEIVQVDKENIFFTNKNVVDSCGLASHTDSYSCIKAALEEFIERQSYIVNYLSKSGGIEIDCSQNTYFDRFYNELGQNLKFYNISIIDEFYVILGISYGYNSFLIGLGASNNLDIAIMKSIREMKQLKTNNSFKLKINKIEDRKMKFTDYHLIFMALSPERLINAYMYLEEKSLKCSYFDYTNKEYSQEKIIMQLYDKYKMKPVIISLGSIRNNNIKIAKIIELNWFENLYVKAYTSNKLNYIENITKKKLDSKCNFLPFP